MSPAPGALLEQLREQMEEEISAYHLLVEEVKKESGYLREGATGFLLESLEVLKILAREIQKKHETAEKTAEALRITQETGNGRRGIAGLLAYLPPQDGRRIKEKQMTLATLRKRILKANRRNKEFAEESLHCCRGLFSLMTGALAGSPPVYFQDGKTRAVTHLPISLNRKV